MKLDKRNDPRWLAGLLILLTWVVLVKGQQSRLAGTWQWTEGDVTLTLKLNADGTGALNGDRFRYNVQANKLLVEDADGETTVYKFSLDGDSLNVSGGALPRALTFTRQGSGRGGLFEKNLGVGSHTSSSKQSEEKRASNGLIGRWQSSAASVEIFADGTLTINNERFHYQVDGNVITLSNNQGSARVQFQLDGDTLTTNYNGERYVYSRVKGNALSGRASAGANPPEMFGKWCYLSNVNANDGGRMSNTCFTLYENGTYDYYSETSSSGPNGGSASQESDSGTWSVSGSTLTANSRARGTINFTLEKRNHPKTGDPMLVLDGDAFVTYSQRRPW